MNGSEVLLLDLIVWAWNERAVRSGRWVLESLRRREVMVLAGDLKFVWLKEGRGLTASFVRSNLRESERERMGEVLVGPMEGKLATRLNLFHCFLSVSILVARE